MTIQESESTLPETLPSSESQPLKKEEKLSRFLAKTVSGTFGIKVINMALVYANSLLLVRLTGVEGYGEYTFIIAWLQILLIPAALGFEGLISRELAVYTAKHKWASAKGILRFANGLVLFNSIAIALIAFLVFNLTGLAASTSSLFSLVVGLATLPFLALSRLRQYSLQAIKRVVAGQLPEMFIRPVIIFGCLAVAFLALRQGMSASVALLINLVATAIAFTIGTVLLTKNIDSQTQAATSAYQPKLWLKAAMPMLLIGSMYVINGQTDSVMLGSLQGAKSVGFYTVANRGASLIGFASIAFSGPLSPVFATLHAQGNTAKLRSTFKKSCQLAFLIAAVLAAVLILLSDQFLGLFGAEFLQSKLALFILLGGQLLSAFSGATPVLLNMTGYARDTVVGVAISAVLNIVLNAWLIPVRGIEGAAIATTISVIVWNALLVGFTYRRFGFFATAIPAWGHRHQGLK